MTRKHPESHQAHMARYGWALPYVFDKVVLEAGSHQGFGAHMMSSVASSILLADYDDVLLKFSEKYFKYFCPVSFLNCDFEKDFPASTDGFDVVTAFEIIEHLENPEFFLENVVKALKPGGRLLFSVPNMLEAKEHKQLFTKESIFDLVFQYLKIEQIFDQTHYLDSTKMMDWKNKTPINCIVGVGIKI